jgi:hypothetical protein
LKENFEANKQYYHPGDHMQEPAGWKWESTQGARGFQNEIPHKLPTRGVSWKGKWAATRPAWTLMWRAFTIKLCNELNTLKYYVFIMLWTVMKLCHAMFGSTSLWKSPPMNHWDAMFGIFPRWCITHHDSMQCFSIFFWFFLNSLGPPSRSRSNSQCHRCLPGGVGTIVWSWF